MYKIFYKYHIYLVFVTSIFYRYFSESGQIHLVLDNLIISQYFHFCVWVCAYLFFCLFYFLSWPRWLTVMVSRHRTSLMTSSLTELFRFSLSVRESVVWSIMHVCLSSSLGLIHHTIFTKNHLLKKFRLSICSDSSS